MLLLVWLLASAAMFLYFFKFLDEANQQTLNVMSDQMQNLAVLKSENENYKRAQSDLALLAQETYQPDNFFSHDITLVNEIKTLEDLSAQLNLKMQLAGVSGTINTAPKATTKTPMAVIPYSIALSGNLQQVVNFIESLEHLSFITNVTSVSIATGVSGQVNASLAANFYLLK